MSKRFKIDKLNKFKETIEKLKNIKYDYKKEYHSYK